MTNPLKELIGSISAAQLWQEEISLKRNDFLKIGGTVDQHLYYIKEGTFRVFVFEGESETTIRFGYPGEVLVALDSYVSGSASPMYIQALKAAEVLKLSKEIFVNHIESQPNLYRTWMALLEQVLLQQMDREFDLMTGSPAERYQRVLHRSPHIFQLIPHKYIASYLRMTPETLSRLQKS